MKGMMGYPAWQIILVEIFKEDRVSVYVISQKTKHIYSYIHRICKEMENLGWITGEKVGRIIHLSLTEKGKLIAQRLYDVISIKGDL